MGKVRVRVKVSVSLMFTLMSVGVKLVHVKQRFVNEPDTLLFKVHVYIGS